MRLSWRMLIVLTAAVAVLGAACSGNEPSALEEAPAGDLNAPGGNGAEGSVAGTIEVDGSSTVAPLTDAVAEEFFAEQPDVAVNIGVSGSGGGFERFCGAGDTDISNASRAIEEEEAALCEENGIEFTEVRVGTDALSMVVNPDNDWVDCLDTEQIHQIWGPDRATTWSQVDPSWPDEPIEIFGPSSTSGTYDFFNEAVGIEQPTQDYSATENDNDIVRGVQGTLGGWGFFGFAFLNENAGGVTALAYDGGEGCVTPSAESAQDGTYGLTRPLFIYVKNTSLSRPEVRAFTTYYLDQVNAVIESVGYIPATEETIEEAKNTLQDAIAAAS